MVHIDREKCNGCGLCGRVCPHGLLTVEGDAALVAGEGCMGCGHCRAVCPQGAVTVDGLEERLGFSGIPEELVSVAPGEYDCRSLVQLMRSRRSCRSYQQKAVELTLLEDLVKVGITAPSGTNSQSWAFVILPERDDVEALGALTADYYRQLNRQAENSFLRLMAKVFAGDALGDYYRSYHGTVADALKAWDERRVDILFHGAPAAILVTGRRDASCPAEDALLASQNILLAAHALGLGSCLIGFAVEAMRRSPRIGRSLGIPQDEQVYSVIALGYPAVTYLRVAGRRPVRPRVVHLGGGKS